MLNHAYTLRGAFINMSDNFQNLGLREGLERNLNGKITREELQNYQDSFKPEKKLSAQREKELKALKSEKKRIDAKIENELAKENADKAKVSKLMFERSQIKTDIDVIKAEQMAKPPQMKQILEEDTFNLLSSACPYEQDGTGIDKKGKAHPGLTFKDLMALTTKPRKDEDRPSFTDIYNEQDPAFNYKVIDGLLEAKDQRSRLDGDSSKEKVCFEYPDNAFLPKNTEGARDRFVDGLKMITDRIKDYYNL